MGKLTWVCQGPCEVVRSQRLGHSGLEEPRASTSGSGLSDAPVSPVTWALRASQPQRSPDHCSCPNQGTAQRGLPPHPCETRGPGETTVNMAGFQDRDSNVQ